MNFGFTPGMGATLLLPTRFGETLGNEMLMAAENFRGGDLEKRGVPFRVVPRAEVLEQALALARSLADKNLTALKCLKSHLTENLRRRLPEFIDKELAMHDVTFRQPEVAARIEHLFAR